MRNINKGIIHCSATPEGRQVTVADIEKWHRARGFYTIGYHYVVYIDGTIHKGRDLSETGAHCYGQNSNSIGICYVGGCDKDLKPKDTLTDLQYRSIVTLVWELSQRFEGITFHGHNEFSDKACPSFNVQDKFQKKISL
ncbi:MAG: N-acetylmuramoyl-L-alanine amidase [Prolixibacteraceae bacterium]|jgi:N-acetylmuramoyl-L-alanine amidase|nr:N-acetylmuramoyl-L-alanine amidase [Prolixibacteraceae bacterium]